MLLLIREYNKLSILFFSNNCSINLVSLSNKLSIEFIVCTGLSLFLNSLIRALLNTSRSFDSNLYIPDSFLLNLSFLSKDLKSFLTSSLLIE